MHFIRSINLIVIVIRVLLRRNIRSLLWLILISGVIMRPNIFIHSANCLVIRIRVLLFFILNLMLWLLLLMHNSIFYWSYYCMSILVIAHYSPRRLRGCSFIILTVYCLFLLVLITIFICRSFLVRAYDSLLLIIIVIDEFMIWIIECMLRSDNCWPLLMII